MRDRGPSGKLLFWACLTGFLALGAVPSVVLIESLQRYWRFLSAWDPAGAHGLAPLKPTQVRFIPHQEPSMRADPAVPLRFVEFRLKAPKAKSVRLAGDFNRWRPEAHPLARDSRSRWGHSKGLWEVLVPLPAGTYRYLFQVDGEWIRDPDAAPGERWSDMETSIKEVP